MADTDNKKDIVLSGIRSTGNLHLGNYFGALSKFVRMQDDYDSNFFLAALHALTTPPAPSERPPHMSTRGQVVLQSQMPTGGTWEGHLTHDHRSYMGRTAHT
ncbi:MAG: hypothetical protein K2L63_01770, partial [Paramuribaculum sp.]|nr:hypothetical protein [Paramuribaculum sp.]